MQTWFMEKCTEMCYTEISFLRLMIFRGKAVSSG